MSETLGSHPWGTKESTRIGGAASVADFEDGAWERCRQSVHPRMGAMYRAATRVVEDLAAVSDVDVAIVLEVVDELAEILPGAYRHQGASPAPDLAEADVPVTVRLQAKPEERVLLRHRPPADFEQVHSPSIDPCGRRGLMTCPGGTDGGRSGGR